MYGRLKEYLLTEDQLKENGYPFPHPERPGGAVIFTADDKKPKDCEWPSAPAVLEDGPEGGGSGRASWRQGVAGPEPPHPPPPSHLPNLLPLWHRVPRVLIRPLRAGGGVQLPLGAAPPEPR